MCCLAPLTGKCNAKRQLVALVRFTLHSKRLKYETLIVHGKHLCLNVYCELLNEN